MELALSHVSMHVFDWPPLLAGFAPHVQDGIIVSPEELTL